MGSLDFQWSMRSFPYSNLLWVKMVWLHILTHWSTWALFWVQINRQEEKPVKGTWRREFFLRQVLFCFVLISPSHIIVKCLRHLTQVKPSSKGWIPSLLRTFIINECWIFSNLFCISGSYQVIFFRMLIWCITSIDFSKYQTFLAFLE